MSQSAGLYQDVQNQQLQQELATLQGAPAAAAPPPPTPAPTAQSQIKLPGQVGGVLGALSQYATLNQSYGVPIQNQPIYQPPKQSYPTDILDTLAQAFGAMDTHPAAQGSIHPHSPLVLAASNGQTQGIHPGQIATLTAKALWDGTLGGWIHTMQTNPAEGLKQAGIGILIGGAAVGAEALTAGLATPLIGEVAAGALASTAVTAGMGTWWAASGGLNSFTHSAADAWNHPTDQTISSLLVNIGSAYLAGVTPIKAFRGVNALRSGLVEGIHTIGQASTPFEIGQEVAPVSGSLLWKDKLNPQAGTTDMLTVPKTASQLEAELQRVQGLSLGPGEVMTADDPAVKELMGQLQHHDRIMEAIRTKGDPSMLDDPAHQEELDALVPELAAATKNFTERYGYSAEDPLTEESLPRLTADEIAGLGHPRRQMDASYRKLMGILGGAGDLHSFVQRPDHFTPGEVVEGFARSVGGMQHGVNLLAESRLEMLRAAGSDETRAKLIDSASEGDHAAWDQLTTPEKYMATKMGDAYGVMGSYLTKHEYIDMPMRRYVPRNLDALEGPMGAIPTKGQAYHNLVEKPVMAVHRQWDYSRDEMTNEIKWRQKFESRDDVEAAEKQRNEFYDSHAAHREVLAKGEEAIAADAKAYGNRKRAVTSAETRQKKAEEEHQALTDERRAEQARFDEINKQWEPLKNDRDPATKETRAAFKTERDAAQKKLAAIDRELKYKAEKKVKLAKESVRRNQQLLADFEKMLGDKGDIHKQLASMSTRDRAKIRDAKPALRELRSGQDLWVSRVHQYLNLMNEHAFRDALTTFAHQDSEAMPKMYALERKYAARPQEVDKSEFPLVVTDDMIKGNIRDKADYIKAKGYVQVRPAVGKPNTAFYKPAVFVRGDKGERLMNLLQQQMAPDDFNNSVTKILYGATVSAPKRFIMFSPAFHAFNVARRGAAFMLDNPALAGVTMAKVLHDRFLDPEQYYHSQIQAWHDGMMPPNRFNISLHVNHLEQELTGQHTFPGIVRTAMGPIRSAYGDTLEAGFWKTVGDLQLAAHVTEKARIMQRNSRIPEAIAGQLAAEYANDIGGMVNPLYMSKLWKHGRQMMFFAPSWWTTFLRQGTASIPGYARLTHLLADHSKLARAADPLKFEMMDWSHRVELVRDLRSNFMTSMAAMLVTADQMNVIFAGHHIWDNPKGHEFDLCFDKEINGENVGTGSEKHACATASGFFGQGADLMKAAGLGHDWGFIHQAGTDAFKNADVLHKVGMLGAALGTGVQQTMASKIGTAPGLVAGVGGGIDLYTLLQQGQIKNIPRSEALLSMLPGGLSVRSIIDQQRRAALKSQVVGGAANEQQAQDLLGQIPKTMASGVAEQFMGLPSIYYVGNEQALGTQFLSDVQYKKYLQTRNDLQAQRLAISDQLLVHNDGSFRPNDWLQKREQIVQKELQLNEDTFGTDSTASGLLKARQDLFKKYNVDDPGLTQSQQITALEQADADWNKILDQATPQARAAWWNVHTAQWTDADYLYQMTQQTKQALMNLVDGEGGNHIRKAQRQYGLAADALPFTATALNDMKQKDPYLFMYSVLLKEMGKSSPLGALTSAWHSPYPTSARMPPSWMTKDFIQKLEDAGLVSSGQEFITADTMQSMAAASEGEAVNAAPQAGREAQTPEFQQQVFNPELQGGLEQLVQDVQANPQNYPENFIQQVEAMLQAHQQQQQPAPA